MWGVPMWASMSACERQASMVTKVPGAVGGLEDVVRVAALLLARRGGEGRRARRPPRWRGRGRSGWWRRPAGRRQEDRSCSDGSAYPRREAHSAYSASACPGRLGSPGEHSRRRPRGHGPRHPPAGRPLRPRQRRAGSTRPRSPPTARAGARSSQLADVAEEQVRAIIEDLARAVADGDASAARRGRPQDRRPLRLLHGHRHDRRARASSRCGRCSTRSPALRDVRDLAAFLGEFERIGGHGLFGSYVDTDDQATPTATSSTSSRAASACPTSPTTATTSSPRSARSTSPT